MYINFIPNAQKPRRIDLDVSPSNEHLWIPYEMGTTTFNSSSLIPAVINQISSVKNESFNLDLTITVTTPQKKP